MMRKAPCSVTVFLFIISAVTSAQQVETVDGVRVVHNTNGGAWGDSP